MLLLFYTPCLTPGTPTEARENFSHKGKRLGNNGKWIHRSGLDPCQFEINGVNSCQNGETAYSLLREWGTDSTLSTALKPYSLKGV